MVEIRLTNSKTRKKEVFEPIDPKNVRMYVCGPTVYDRAHLGNARPVVVFDVLNRLLRYVYGSEHVTYVRNFTDVDDKINATALARKEAGAEGSLEDLIHERTEETIGWYHADMDALGALRPDHEPRATGYIPQMIAMIEGLITRGHAYAAEGHVLFSVGSYADYGALSGRSVEDMIAGARVEVAPYKRDPMDFVLWKPSSDDLPGWDSPWGRGRPGWHIECSAMADDILGEEFDIHGGGIDLQFPHHENEIAQSCCAHDHGGFARVWLHNEMLQVEGKKMSKSLGNFFTVRDLLDQGVPGEVIRFVFLGTHYRKPMDWTEKKRAEAEATLRKIALRLKDALELDLWSSLTLFVPPKELVDALCDDLNTSLALTHLNRYLKNSEIHNLLGTLVLLGFSPEGLIEEFAYFEARAGDNGVTRGSQYSSLGGDPANGQADLQGLGRKLAELREAAMASKDFSEVDRLKAALIEAGVEVQMSKNDVTLLPGAGFDPAKLEGLL
ncbi:cysteinyl-tRNA synthetase [Pseudooceanicola nitratireducens]|jgi:cysteinyl-tRNA synthetase|uniref:Cysteine--tRNA ligase n=1 Tax=Pseudooceanicola nitratireducens TaxID=517719 RepID=A0A1I1KZ01_9RHOB|nr:cysteine--tRNA ligase [Pseudooceanicola nitratireducens]SEJ41914.1 cysteinyl-tRNA synthetase [Pseudooceanicola nitratireducens]SFC65971.1 cysteinyl-tRNA synthetase [Pseudooceanicola nitratireducens]